MSSHRKAIVIQFVGTFDTPTVLYNSAANFPAQKALAKNAAWALAHSGSGAQVVVQVWENVVAKTFRTQPGSGIVLNGAY